MGDSLDMKKNQPMRVRAESLYFLSDENLFVAEGSVEITYGTIRLAADRVEFYQDTRDAVAIGNVVYEEEGETLMAERAEINFETELGTAYRADLTLEDDQYISGRKIEKIGPQTYIIRRGSFTGCSSSNPDWKFSSTWAKVDQGEYLQAANTVGLVKGLPAFYFPYFIYPIKTERQTGFLIPDFGNSSSNGLTLSNAFFWAITDSQDATLTHTYYEFRGHKLDLEYRYKYNKDTDGTFRGQYIKDDLDLSEKTRLHWNHQQGLPFSIKALVNLDWMNDNQFDEDFSTDLVVRTDQKLRSNVSFTRSFSQHSVRLLFDRLDDLREESDEQTDQRFPELQLTSQKQQLFGSPLYIQQTTTVSRLNRDGKEGEELEFGRLDIQPTLSLPLNLLGQALTVTPQLYLRETYYTHNATTAADPDLEAEPVHREYYKTSVSLNGPKFNRIFDLGLHRKTQKLKHLIEPTLSFQYAPGINEEDLPKFDGTDRIGSQDQSMSMSYGTTQRLLAKRVTDADWTRFLDEEEDIEAEDLGTTTEEWASFSLSQSYNFEAEEYPFSNVNASLNTEPLPGYKLSVSASYDVYVNELTSTSIDLKGKLWNFFKFKLSWRHNQTVNRDTEEITSTSQFLDTNTRLILFNSRLSLTYRSRFNIEENERIEDNFGITYNAQCWNISGNYREQLVGDELDRSYNVLLELKHLGKLLDIKQSDL